MTLALPEKFHLAVIMDGNGRWGERQKKSRIAGHEEGMKRLEEMFDAAAEFGVNTLTIFAFSTENWKRSEFEVQSLMRIFNDYITTRTERLLGENVRVRFIGDKSPFSKKLIDAMVNLEKKTEGNTKLNLNVAMNYGGQDEILRTVRRLTDAGITAPTAQEFEAHLDTAGSPQVDLMIRTSGEMRISNFMLWQLAYAEMYFTDVLWPDFDKAELKKALDYYIGRDRRFGGV